MSLLQQPVLGHERTTRGKLPESTAYPNRDPLEAGNGETIALANSLARSGKLPQALRLLTERLAGDPDEPALRYARALTLSDWGRLRESLEDLRAAESSGLTSIGLHLNTAQICHRLGYRDEAEQRARLAISLDPRSAHAHECLAMLLQAGKRYDDAVRSYEQAYGLAPERVDYLAQIAVCKVGQNDGPGAEAVIRKVMSIDGDESAKSWIVLGLALSEQERHGEAWEAFDRAEKIELRTGQAAEAFVPHGLSLTVLGHPQEAIELYERYLPSQPDSVAHTHYGFALLAAGRYRDGWEQYEFRRFEASLPLTRMFYGRPAWHGQCVRGKTLLVWAEQGIGDMVQFARFGRRLHSEGATVVLQVRENLKEFAADLAGFDRVIVDPREIDTGFDFHCPAMSAARFLCPDIASIPADVPYLRVDSDRLQHWRERLGCDGRLKVGLVWRGNPKHENDRHRSIDLSRLAPLWGIEGVHYVSLQKERSDRDAEPTSTDARWTDAALQLRDFRDTAAVIEALDLVISVDTAVAHIAGALGKPVWMLVAAASDFRWLRDRDDSPWYPTMRLFRQLQLGKWDEVVERVGRALQLAVQEQRAGRPLKALLPPTGSGAAPALSVPHDSGPSPSPVSRFSRVAETRYGMLQYMPRGDDIARSIALYGEWLQPQIDLLGKLLQPGARILEAQAGIGIHAIALAQVVGEAGILLAYEEDAILKRILLRNVRDHGNVVMVMHHKLVGTDERERDTRSPSADNTRATVAEETETIDELLLERLDLIKLNEGVAACAVLKGAATTLWRLRPKLFLPVPDPAIAAPLVEHVRSYGYRCWRTESSLYPQNNFNRCDTDIFPGMKAVALIAIPEESDIDMTSGGFVELQS